MIDSYNLNGTRWARFSDDMTMRYGLGIAVSDRTVTSAMQAAALHMPRGSGASGIEHWLGVGIVRIVWLMLNPSTADAFRNDPTVTNCIKFTKAWGGDICEVVNLFSFRSPYPADIASRSMGDRGDDAINDGEILAACTGAYRVITAWGTDGALGNRDILVRRALAVPGIAQHHLGLTKGGYPKHPLARGKHRIPADQQPIPWAA